MIAEKLMPDQPIVPRSFFTITKPTKFGTYELPGIKRTPPPPPNHDFVGTLVRHKKILKLAFQRCHISNDRRILLLAMAMGETNTMSPCERDWTKDSLEDGSRNHTIFNINESFTDAVAGIRPPRPQAFDIPDLNAGVPIDLYIKFINTALDKWGVIGTLGFHRGGTTTFNSLQPGFERTNPEAWRKGRCMIGNYFAAIKTIMLLLESQPSLQTDGLRVNIDVSHI